MISESRRFNRNTSLSMVMIPIGKSKYIKQRNGLAQTVYFIERKSFGVVVIAAITRYGKSVLVRNIFTQVGQHRPVIILDYIGEHSNARWPNFLSADRNSQCLPNMREIKGFKFKISQFDKAEDWASLGFSGRGPLLMMFLAKHREAHADDPDLFLEMLGDLPISPGETAPFNARWGFLMPKQNPQTVDSCKQLYEYLHKDKFFAAQEDRKFDFGQLSLNNSHLNINFGLDQADKGKARAMAGKVLEQLENVLHLFNVPPLIVVEEADVLAPNEPDTMVMMSSLSILIKFVLKLQKKRIELMFIVQDPKNLHPKIFENRHTFIYGQLPGSETPRSKRLLWNADKNYREFIMERTGQPSYETFSPEDSCTIY